MLVGNNLFKSAKHCKAHVTNYVGVRWKTQSRKPFWMGIAKTKIFVVPKKAEVPPEQEAEVKRLHDIYGRQMRALQNVMMNIKVDNEIDTEKIIDSTDYKKDAMVLHDSWNAESARLREERLKKEEEEATEAILNQVTQQEIVMKELETKVKQIVVREIELSETYITPENLDKAIDDCLASVVDYNYALDLSGNVYKGESMTPTDKLKPAGGSSQIEEMIHEKNSPKENETSKTL